MKIAFGIFLLIVFFSCQSKENKADILSQNKMQEVMWDMMRADQQVADSAMKDSSLNKKDRSALLYEKVFQLHKISSVQFKKSLDYYTSSPMLFRTIIDSLSKKKVEVVQTLNHPFKKDSVKSRQIPSVQ